ncbi:helix-turn-helix domain-containing protein [Canibacter sp. lx-72]|uniref:Rv2175c family DNA-binding protein n=1 Tax=Canibacter zhuwentaonis TaxID=2837491 RepID=UPI001BDDA0FE|nr:Rv2175c family DNA-binding protein [Canibacter zhuwentaonis]MBT1018237.1 helix-turn-helix domain-containing protein [Canibacter zhuwentaonis]MBT1035247.1 helix-turn-helix domain-containing protein [Canibacter zhuwentaonis]
MENIATYSIEETAEIIGLSQSKVRRMLQDNELAAIKADGEVRVPQEFLLDGTPLATLQGTLTVLADAGIKGEAAVQWLFTANEQLDNLAPVTALREGRKKPVRAVAALLAL